MPGKPADAAEVAAENASVFDALPEDGIAVLNAAPYAGGVLASLMAVWHALRTPAQLALGG